MLVVALRLRVDCNSVELIVSQVFFGLNTILQVVTISVQ